MLLFGWLSHRDAQRSANHTLKDIHKTLKSLSKIDDSNIFDTEKYVRALQDQVKILEFGKSRHHKADVGGGGLNRWGAVDARDRLRGSVESAASLLKEAKLHIKAVKKGTAPRIIRTPTFAPDTKIDLVDITGKAIVEPAFDLKAKIDSKPNIQKSASAGKAALVVAGLAAVVGVISWLVVGGKRKEETKQARSNISPINTVSMDTNTLMGFEPVAGERAAQIMARRGGAMGIDTSNPAVMLPYDVIH